MIDPQVRAPPQGGTQSHIVSSIEKYADWARIENSGKTREGHQKCEQKVRLIDRERVCIRKLKMDYLMEYL